ncbi:putative endosomal sorting complex protein TSG101 [Aspergillus clavatus NRRL 1]|uniref:Endosomal sorting complex protein TSG101, putative n=1 Tax=Aspergillus clavatus (strain ATCC 1007 / CBS 513.65 / DSM 816 / NCTC 3887 / NRRL 1 / QM 1276 / 107) TaxID=344612 RepID=A1CLD9_ASPCL|nr:endosomal sorting complex protein TSG101, putative [Aspergillus clavatus NRRL 1]EAW09963.1 endosomal sorting complex protein TSG101, putative [Aspergillus clavatus NRRL 1]
MAAVPQRTLNWLYSVLTRDHYDPNQTYQDPNRTYYDVANVLAQYPSLSPRTDVYTYENGFSALLLHLTGTLPVTFRGTVYKFPIALWIPNTYPREPPMVYVTPTQDMAVRVGQHVTLEGRVYHHYLAHWAEAWDRSSLVDFLLILREVFAKEPPVKNKQPQIPQRTQPSEPTQGPPPLPPLPPELGSAIPRPPAAPLSIPPQPTDQVPPPPPPKPGQVVTAGQQQQASPAGRYDSPPPLPPLPPKEQDLRRQSFQPHAGFSSPAADQSSQYLPERDAARRLSHPPQQQYATQPMTAYPASAGGVARSPPPPQGIPRGPPQPPLPVQQQGPTRPPGWQPNGARYQQQPPVQPVAIQAQHPRQPPQPAAKSKAQTPDLLTSPFELELPSFTPTGPAPPIPPNPEKDALLHAVSKTLAETVQANAAQSEAAAHSLLSQSESLHAAIASLQGEIASLNALNSTLQSNTSILTQSLHRADAVIADAQTRIASTQPSSSTSASTSTAADAGLPPIDDVLVAPTVVGKQLYDLVAEERGIQQAIYALQSALVKGFVGVETWSRHTRGLAREAFLKRALIRKIGRGMGLEES